MRKQRRDDGEEIRREGRRNSQKRFSLPSHQNNLMEVQYSRRKQKREGEEGKNS